MRPVLLASTSRHRRALLTRLRIPFDTADPGVDEARADGEPPRALAARLARAKAQAVAARHPTAIVIGSDQVCATADQVLGKPGTPDANREMLAQLSGRTAVFHTAVAIVGLEAGLQAEHVDDTVCHFRALKAEEIACHVAIEPGLDCAGGFKSESLGITLMTRIDSQDPTALVGLPMIWVAGALRPFICAGASPGRPRRARR
ncbi:MAG: septum formation protein Maf [Gammaproteobacteria bacterium]|nr:septum formation protein Maf [Gammaproteobacteria bacterium]